LAATDIEGGEGLIRRRRLGVFNRILAMSLCAFFSAMGEDQSGWVYSAAAASF
jgi:hypothetical protein